MLITFTSVSNAHQKDNKISFTAPVVVTDWNGFKVFEFAEPTMNEQNRVEVSPEIINIMAGRNTLNLSLGEKVSNEYIVPNQGSIYLNTQLHNVDIFENLIKFSYSIFQDNKEISSFDLTLEFKTN